MNKMSTYLLQVKEKYKSEYDPEKFKPLGLPENKEVEKLVDVYRNWFEEKDIEIFAVEGRQFITEKGIYMILSEKELDEMKEVEESDEYEERTIPKTDSQ